MAALTAGIGRRVPLIAAVGFFTPHQILYEIQKTGADAGLLPGRGILFLGEAAAGKRAGAQNTHCHDRFGHDTARLEGGLHGNYKVRLIIKKCKPFGPQGGFCRWYFGTRDRRISRGLIHFTTA
jgi:hypothetical protein